jgi:hypothetical protein
MKDGDWCLMKTSLPAFREGSCFAKRSVTPELRATG